MKIGIDISQIVFEGTGVATYTRNLVTHLLRIDPQDDFVLYGSSLRLLALLKDFAKGKRVQSSFWPIPPTAATILWNTFHSLPIENLTGKLDVFHTSDWTQPKTNCPKVATIHDLVIYKFPESSHGKTEFRSDSLALSPNIVANQKKTLELIKKECSLIMVDSIATMKDCQEILGIPEEKMRVVYLAAGNNVEEFMAQSVHERMLKVAEAKKKYGLEKKYILFVGTRGPRKNLDRLIEAYQKLADPEVELVIVGTYGWGKDEKKVVGVKILGFVPSTDLAPLWHGAECFAYPSLYEGFGVPILESMTLECPVITSNVSSMPEAGGDAAFYVDPTSVGDIASQLALCLSLPLAKRRALIKKGKEQVAKFSWEKTARETLAVYNEAAKRTRL